MLMYCANIKKISMLYAILINVAMINVLNNIQAIKLNIKQKSQKIFFLLNENSNTKITDIVKKHMVSIKRRPKFLVICGLVC